MANNGNNNPSNTASHMPQSLPSERPICETASQPSRVIAKAPIRPARTRTSDNSSTGELGGISPVGSRTATWRRMTAKPTITTATRPRPIPAMAMREKRGGPGIVAGVALLPRRSPWLARRCFMARQMK